MSTFALIGELVDVRGFEPLTPCLQIQKASSEEEKADEQK